MKYFLIAGEASGDLHASNLMKGLLNSDREASFHFIGGDLMLDLASDGLRYHYRNMNFMGLFAVIANLRILARIFKRTKKDIIEFKPDAIILVDYAGFNLRIAKFASKAGIKVFYYISPKVWAWRKGRIKSLKKFVDKLFVIFPFEPEFFKENGMDVEFHGNPLTDVIAAYFEAKKEDADFRKEHQLDDRPIIALLPGSRKQELLACLPVMREAAKVFPSYQFVVAGAPSCDHVIYKQQLDGTDIKVVYNAGYDLLSNAYAGVITSGTATLETALFNVPQLVIYKTGKLTYKIGKLFVNLRFFGLVNLVYGDELVKELLQNDLVERTKAELQKILDDTVYRERIIEGYDEIRRSIGEKGASQRAADKMIELIRV